VEGSKLRKGFSRELGQIDAKVLQLFALVTESLGAATDTLLAGDRATAKEIKQRDQIIDGLFQDIEQLVERTLVLQSPVAGDLRFLLSVLRIVPELERSGDLAEHIATRANLGLAAELTPQARGMVAQLGSLGVEMWRAATDAYADRDGTAFPHLDALDDEVDRLHDELVRELENKEIPRRVAIEMALVARFYERLGDHAVHITARVVHAQAT
jgi:phosphate transport system protein